MAARHPLRPGSRPAGVSDRRDAGARRSTGLLQARPHVSDTLGCAPDDWNIDAWLNESFGVWRDEKQDVVLRVPSSSAARARHWRFHGGQQIENLADGGLRIRFASGGMRELAEHLFTWGGELVIEGPDVLVAVVRERIAAAQTMLPPTDMRPILSQSAAKGAS